MIDFSHPDDGFLRPRIGAPISELLAKSPPDLDPLHALLPPGTTLLGGAAKAGKSTLAKQIAFEVSLNEPVLYFALEYNLPMVKSRFHRIGSQNNMHMITEGEIKRFGEGGEKDFAVLLTNANPRLVVIDFLTKLKRSGKDCKDEYRAFSDLKEIWSRNMTDCLVLHHTKKARRTKLKIPLKPLLVQPLWREFLTI